MNSYELKPTYENLIETYEKDSIGRNRDIKSFSVILNSLSDFCSIALDGEWGSGKTFFVKQTKLFIDAHNNHIRFVNEGDKSIFIDTKDSEEYQPQVTVYYDAWENDNDSDPILSLVHSIINNVDTDFTFKETNCLDKAASILELFTGRNCQDVIQTFRGENPLEEVRKTKDIEGSVKDFLDSILAERGNRLIIFIDELDRCKPSYAVRLLERIKHYFTNYRITFVFSINVQELQHTIKKYYGNDFDACRYLDRFFDLRISLPPADKEKFYNSINFRNEYTYDRTCRAVIENYDFSLREIAKYVKISQIAAYEPTHDSKKFDFIFSDGKGRLFCLMYIVPIMLGLRIYNVNEYENFIKGNNCTPFIEVISRLKYHHFNDLLSQNETFDETVTDKTYIKLDDKLKEVYETIFKTIKDESSFCTSIGQFSFERGTKELLLRIVSLLSNYATIEKGEE